MTAWQSAGKVRMTPKGTWNSNVAYEVLDLVTDTAAEKTYLAKKDVPKGTSLGNTEYWDLTSDVSGVINAFNTKAETQLAADREKVDDMMEEAANSVSQMQDYTNEYSTRVKGEILHAEGNPIIVTPDAGSLLQPVTVFDIKQEGEGDPYPAGAGKNFLSGCTNTVNATYSNGEITIGKEDTDTYIHMIFDPKVKNLVSIGDYVYLSFKARNVVDGWTWGFNSTAHLNNGDCSIPKDGSIKVFAYSVTQEILNQGFIVLDDLSRSSIIKPISQNMVFYDIGIYLSETDALEYVPYSNIRPISGWDSLNLTRAGKNLLPPIATSVKTLNGVTWTPKYDSHGRIVGYETSGTATGSTNINEYGYFTLPAGTYIVSGAPSGSVRGNGDIVVQDIAYNGIARSFDGSTIDKFTLTTETKIRALCQFSSGTVTDGKKFEPMIRLASDLDTTFEPYQADTYTVQIGENVYGGKMNWLTGEFVADMIVHTYSSSDYMALNGTGTNYTKAVWALPDKKYTGDKLLFSHFKTIPVTTDTNNTVGYFGSDVSGFPANIYLQFPPGHTIDTIKAWMAEQGVQVAYKIEPTANQLTPHQILALQKETKNFIYGDGYIELDYVKPLSVERRKLNNLMEACTDPFEVSGNPAVCNMIGEFDFEKVETEFVPKQEGSGDPYPAGGGKNLLPYPYDLPTSASGVTITVGADGSIKLSGTATSDPIRTIKDFTLQAGTYCLSVGAVTANAAIQLYPIKDDGSLGTLLTQAGMGESLSGTFTLGSATNVRCRLLINPGAVDVTYYPMLELGSVPSSFAPYSNIRPISGYDNLNLTRCGKNLIDNSKYDSSTTRNGVTFTVNDDGTILMDGTATGDIQFNLIFKSDDTYYLKPGRTYTVSFGDAYAAITGAHIVVGYLPYKNSSWAYAVYANGEKSYTFTMPDEFVGFMVRIRLFSGAVCNNVLVTPQIEVGTQATSFEPYQANIYTVQIGETVYGGRMNWLTGELVAEWECKDASTLSWNIVSDFAHTVLPKHTDIICSHYKYVGIETNSGMLSYDKAISRYTNNTDIRLRDTDFSTIDEYTSFFSAQSAAGTPVQIAHKLATPKVIQLTPQQIVALQGVNTLYGDGDVIGVEGRQPKHIAIEERVAALESAIINLVTT